MSQSWALSNTWTNFYWLNERILSFVFQFELKYIYLTVFVNLIKLGKVAIGLDKTWFYEMKPYA